MKSRPVILFLVLLSLLPCLSAHAQSTGARIFLKLPGLSGDVAEAGHENEIAVKSVAFGVVQPSITNAGSGAASPARAQLSTITIQKVTDKTSPLLFVNAALGRAFPTARVTLQNLTTGVDFFTFDLNNVIIASYSVAAVEGDETVQETLTLSYTQLQLTFRPSNVDTPTIGIFDVLKNKASQSP